ncbi:mycofactocin-coupled SDR family oxidoreductase [Prescottella agglutinans]|uniref:3-oxoacyl-[acyl-carrier-protein] reductase MabA n=1 Tax=Prescottella agglutinans TaxID=1644129 RepID=A0ABT6M6D0_9NOCA|nr:mycofactocin-coupled SDR family oxidoreductase [Prescottella agglutinans]MDH6279855.1 SDR family mycofactocin-dependent oxidoreductase [Prescottella agglutinans]
MVDLTGKVAFVTGAARGQGRSHALTLARAGADVAVTDICRDAPSISYPLATPDDLDETVRQVKDLGRQCLPFVLDVRDGAALDHAVDDTVNRLGSLDICVANAGVCGHGKFWEITDSMWDEMIGIDLTGVFKTLRAVTPTMIAQGSGRIVATASMGGRMGNPNLAHYVAAKWGVIGLVKTLALEVARYGITVNAVCPATVDTQMVHNASMYELFCPELDSPDRKDVEPIYAQMSPMRVPWIDPQDVADAVLYLVSEQARYITGSTLDVCTGATAGMP